MSNELPDHATASQTKPEPTSGSRIAGIVAATPVAALGLLTILGNAALLAYRIFDANDVPWQHVPWRFKFFEYELRGAAMLVGALFIYAAVCFARSYWRRGAIAVVAAVVLALINPPLNTVLRREIAGERYRISPTGEEVPLDSP